MKIALLSLSLGFLLLISILLLRTALFRSKQVQVEPVAAFALNAEAAAQDVWQIMAGYSHEQEIR